MHELLHSCGIKRFGALKRSVQLHMPYLRAVHSTCITQPMPKQPHSGALHNPCQKQAHANNRRPGGQLTSRQGHAEHALQLRG
jgi:hypothetical protein